MDELFTTIRESCSTHAWSLGVQISRQNGVIAESLSEEVALLRVSTPGKVVSASVQIQIEEQDWMCDCGYVQSCCEHVAAAIITLRRAWQKGETLPLSPVSRGLIQYYFTRKDGSLALKRAIRVNEEETPLAGSLLDILSGRVPGPLISASKPDFLVDALVRELRWDNLPTKEMGTLLRHLVGREGVHLDGQKIKVGAPALTNRVAVLDGDADGGVIVRGEDAPEVTEVFRNSGLVREGELCARDTADLIPAEKQLVERGRYFSSRELAELASYTLPSLAKKIAIDVRTTRLPRTAGANDRPQLIFQTAATGDMLSVLPVLVYGDPPYARVDAGRLVMLGEATVVPSRNRLAEQRLANELHGTLGFSVGKRLEFRGEAATGFVERLRSLSAKVVGNGLTYFGTKSMLAPKVSVTKDDIDVEFRLADGKGRADARAVFRAWQEGLGRVALLDEDGWAPVPKEWLDKYGHRLLELLAARKDSGELPPQIRPELARLCQELDTPCPPEFSKLAKQLDKFEGLTSVKLPKDLTATLRSYQHQGVNWLSFLQQNSLGALLADDMGLGKTLQTLCVLKGKVLVVCPTSVLPNWKQEITRFRPNLKVSVYHGGARELETGAVITLTTYALLRLDVDLLSSQKWDIVVLDEAQNIKNPESQMAQAAYRLKADFRVALTGTPVENRLEDLWSLFHFLNPGLLGGRADFQKRYSPLNLQRDNHLASQFRSRIKPFILRRLKSEVAPELPPRTELVAYCELEPVERETYQALMLATKTEVLEALASEGNVMAALEFLLRLRQAACHNGLLPGQSAENSSKVRLLCDMLEEVVNEDHKALVFSQWTSLLDLIEPHLKDRGLNFLRIDGSTKDRASIVSRFQSASGPPVLLMTLKAGGVGLNLTAADHVFLADPWWNPAAEDQAADRAHRIGQDRPVFIHRLVAKDTVEEKILALQERKRATAAMALDGATAAASLTRADLLALLS